MYTAQVGAEIFGMNILDFAEQTQLNFNRLFKKATLWKNFDLRFWVQVHQEVFQELAVFGVTVILIIQKTEEDAALCLSKKFMTKRLRYKKPLIH